MGDKPEGGMFEDAEKQLQRILNLVEQCPAPFKEACFSIFLRAYVESALQGSRSRLLERTAGKVPVPPPAEKEQSLENIPAEVSNRFRTLAKRLEATSNRLGSLFDFTSDPFKFHPFTVPGQGNSEKTRNVALLVAARGYIATGSWLADWKEVKALCVDQNCYDQGNHAKFLARGSGSKFFKRVETGKSLELTSPGREAAEALLKRLATKE